MPFCSLSLHVDLLNYIDIEALCISHTHTQSIGSALVTLTDPLVPFLISRSPYLSNPLELEVLC
jgi:hypothetical protein